MPEITPVTFWLVTFGVSLAAGLLGSLLGVGGGIIVVPALTLLLKVDIHLAIAASLIGVIATSTGSAASFVRQRLANLRVAMLLETTTTVGALTGALVAGYVADRWLFLVFAALLLYAGGSMLWTQLVAAPTDSPVDELADRLALHESYFDPATGKQVEYRVARVRFGLIVGAVAGLISGLLGVGGGILKVPAMHLGMRMPIKASTATSNFIMGVTAATSAVVYLARGQVVPLIAAPVGAGVLIGATAGAKMLPRIKSAWVKLGFTGLLLYVAVQMATKGLGSR